MTLWWSEGRFAVQRREPKQDKGYSEPIDSPSLVEKGEAEHQSPKAGTVSTLGLHQVGMICAYVSQCQTDSVGQNIPAEQGLDSDLVITAT